MLEYLDIFRLYLKIFRDTINNKLRIPYSRPWGQYESFIDFHENNLHNDESGYKVKRIIVKPNSRLSLQSHDHRSEHWILVQGSGLVQVGDDTFNLQKNQHIFIPKNSKHRMTNTNNEEELVFIEVQIGNYLGEDDITRYQDDFGRT